MSERTSPAGDHHVLILGCGYTGCALASRLAFAGTPVIGTTRTEARASVIRTRGARPVMFDGRDRDALAHLRGRVRAIVNLIPPQRAADGSYSDPTEWLLDAVGDWEGLSAFVYVSSTSVYGDRRGEVVTERTPTAPDSARGRAREVVEARVLGAGLPATVVRPSGIYGPGRSQLHRVASGKYKLVGDGSAITNRIHVHDLAATIEAALQRGEPGEVYLASDEAPTSQRAVVDHIVDTFGLPRPIGMSLAEARVRLSKNVLSMVLGSKRLDASATRASLGVRLRYPTYREGLAEIWRTERAAIEGLVAAADDTLED